MRWLTWGMVLAVALALTAGAAPAADEDQLAALDGLLAEGRPAEAATRAADLLRSGDLQPRNVWRVRQRLAAALLDLDRPAEAVPELEAALADAPDEPALHLSLGRALSRSGKRGRAIAEYQTAVHGEPGRYEWRLEYAEALLDLGARRDALAEIASARRTCGECRDALRAEVDAHLRVGDHRAAVAPLRRLYASSGGADDRLLLGQCLWNADDAGGVAALLDTVAANALDPRERMLALQADRRLGRSARALRYVAAGDAGVDEVAMAADHAWALVAEICLADDHAAEALVAIDRAVARAPRQAVHHHNRAAILVALGRQDEARAALDRARALDPGLGR